MPNGISTSMHCDAAAACLRDAGIDFVVRYHSARTKLPQKRLSPGEAAHLAREGLKLVTVYQDNARLPQDFGFERGQQDGMAAFGYASQVGQPPDSAVYFAVDTDFSASQLAQGVVPYFEGVRAGLKAAAGGTDPFRIGVYGSGLSCRVIKDDHQLAQLSWLALATAWRESQAYDNWDMRQAAPTEALCSLGLRYESNLAREGFDAFGAFTPIGAQLQGDQGPKLRVTASELLLRAVPSLEHNTPIARLREGQVVRLLGDALPPFRRVRATIQGGEVIGYASGRHLQPLAEVPSAPGPSPSPSPSPSPQPFVPPPVHYQPGDTRSRRDSISHRAKPLGEPDRPRRDAGADPATRVAQLDAIVDWLAVETSARYARTPSATYCNIYAADYCYLAEAYLPRTWWKGSALAALAQGQSPEVLYDTTVREMRADDLLGWLQEWGAAYGWHQVFDATALQAAADAGGVGLICADRAVQGLPGHITVVVPQSATARARLDPDGHVVVPLQSQAGARNRARAAGSDWWSDANTYRDRGFFVHA